MTLLSQPHWFHGVTRAWHDVSAPSEGQQLQASHTIEVCGQELVQGRNTSAATPICSPTLQCMLVQLVRRKKAFAMHNQALCSARP